MKNLITSLAALAIAIVPLQAVSSDFLFNFDPHGTAIPGGSNIAGSTYKGNDGTRFFQDVINIDGNEYFHVVVGDEESGFANEFYIAATVQDLSSSGTRSSSTSGGNERALIGNFSTAENEITLLPGRQFGNAKDPFGITVDESSGFTPYDLSGNGTADPTRVTLRMVVNDGTKMHQEVSKPFLDKKPSITQSNNDGDLSSFFSVDLTNISYSQDTSNAEITNVIEINIPSMPSTTVPFDVTKQSQTSYVDAGKYIFLPGGGWSAPSDPSGTQGWDVDNSTYDEGTYKYTNSSFDVKNANWSSFFDPAQNTTECQTGWREHSVCPN